jgi:hypothetical protein
LVASLVGVAVLGTIAYRAFTLLTENIAFKALGITKIERTDLDKLSVTANFIISNASNVDLSLVSLFCANIQRRLLIQRRPIDIIRRPCKIEDQPAMPFVLKAGGALPITATMSFEPADNAKLVLRAFNEKLNLLEFSRQLALHEINVYGASRPLPIPFNSSKMTDFAFEYYLS